MEIWSPITEPGMWCGFGRDAEALQNLNFCLTSHLAVLDLSESGVDFYETAKTEITEIVKNKGSWPKSGTKASKMI